VAGKTKGSPVNGLLSTSVQLLVFDSTEMEENEVV
jgi:hypothetical protein